MHPAEFRFVELAKRFAILGMQTAQAYNQQQAELKLDLVLSQARLSTPDGTHASQQTIGHLRQLTEAHKHAYKLVVLAATSEITAAIAEMPSERQSAHYTGLVASINWQLHAQAHFYSLREQWMDAAEEICELIASKRETCTFSEAGVDFAQDADLLRFSELLGVIEHAHLAEVEAIKERLDRLGQAISVLGIGAGT